MKSPPGIECGSVITNFGDDLAQAAFKEEQQWV